MSPTLFCFGSQSDVCVSNDSGNRFQNHLIRFNINPKPVMHISDIFIRIVKIILYSCPYKSHHIVVLINHTI